MAFALPLLLAVLVAGSQWVSNPEDLGKRFARAQRLLATGDFAGAQQLYREVLAVPDQPLVHPSRVQVQVDEQEVGLREAARYQLANLSRRQAQLARQEAALAAPQEADSLEQVARTHLHEAARGFAALRDEEGFGLRPLAAYLAVDCLFEAGDFEGVKEAGQVLLTRFPDSPHASRTRYTLGWAYFNLKEYAQAVEVFAQFIQDTPDGIQADRARLQLGLALEALQRYPEALAAFSALAQSYDPASMNEDTQTQTALAGLREGQSRRSLAAKAWLKQGDVLKVLGRVEEALAAYQKVGESFPQEERLAEMAWVRQALLAQETQGLEAALAVYRYAAEQSQRPGFQARMQAGVMSLLFEEEKYEEALAAHQLYVQAYADQTEEAGVSLDEAQFRIGECLRSLGEAGKVDSLLHQAVDHYRKVADYPHSYLVPEAWYWQGYTWQVLGKADSAQVCFSQVVERAPRTELACRATLELARQQPEGVTLYEQVLAQCPPGEVQAIAALELGRQRRLGGDLGGAEAALSTIPPDQPQYLYAQLEWAQLFLQQGNASQALSLLEQYQHQVQDPKEQAQVQAQLGLLYQEQEQPAQAVGLLRQALPLLDGEMRGAAQLGLSGSLYQQGQYEEAWQAGTAAWQDQALALEQRTALLRVLGACAQALGRPDQVVPLYQALGEGEGTLALGQYYLDAGQPEQTAALMRGMAEGGKDSSALRARLLWGKALQVQDSTQAAQQVLAAGLRLSPDAGLAAEYHFELGSAALGAQDFTTAEKEFGAALQQAQRRELQAAAQYYLAQSLQASGQDQAARTHFSTLVQEYPDQRYAAESAFLLAEGTYNAGDYTQAQVQYTQVFQQWSQSKEATEALFGAAWCSLELKEEEEMVRLFQRLAQEYPDAPKASEGLLALADYYYNAKSYAQAGSYYQQLVDRFPHSREATEAQKQLRFLGDVEADALYTQAMARYDAQEYAQAIPLLQQVIAQYPGTPSEAAARCNLGMAYQQLQSWDLALHQYEETIAVLEQRPEEHQALEFAQQSRAWVLEQRRVQ